MEIKSILLMIDDSVWDTNYFSVSHAPDAKNITCAITTTKPRHWQLSKKINTNDVGDYGICYKVKL